MSATFILHDTGLKPTYLGYGAYGSLLHLATGHKLNLTAANRIFLRMQSVFPRQERVTRFIQTLQKITGENINALLFCDVSSCDDAFWEGIFTANQNHYFAKVYKRPEDLIFALQQAKFIKQYFSGRFVIPPHVAGEEGILISQVVEKKRAIKKGDHVEERLVQMSLDFMAQNFAQKRIGEMMPIGFSAMCAANGNHDLMRKLTVWQAREDIVITLIPVHGSMTSKNLYVSGEERLVLLGCDRAGWHVPFYDVFHFILQPDAASVKDRSSPLRDLLKREWMQDDRAKRALVLYLVDQIFHDMPGDRDKSCRTKSRDLMVRNKLAWLDLALDALKG